MDFVRENSRVDLEGLRPYCTCQQCGFGTDDQQLKSFQVFFLFFFFLTNRGGGTTSADSQSGS